MIPGEGSIRGEYMRYFILFCLIRFNFYPTSFMQLSHADEISKLKEKEWTFLIYLNGKNSLDDFGPENISQMEHVGSTEHLNILVQWASLSNHKTQRLYVTQNLTSHGVTSPILQDLGDRIDMGDWHNLVEFIRWGVANYPAKHYFIDIWDHGSGWHPTRSSKSILEQMHATDISWDDSTGHAISTIELGKALSAAAKIIGHKVDVYASDACLMAMAEIADQLSHSVKVFAGSEELEPGPGWPYEPFLKRWTSQPDIAPVEIAGVLTDEYIKSYTGGTNGTEDATFSSFNLLKMNHFNSKIASFGRNLLKLSKKEKARIIHIASATQNFTYNDYVDLSDFLSRLEVAKIKGLQDRSIANLRIAINEFITSNGDSPNYKRAGGLSIWLPTSLSTYNSFKNEYKKLKFYKDTKWSDVIGDLLQETTN